jgi:hypothetical protein
MVTSQADAAIDQLEKEIKNHYLAAMAGLLGHPDSSSDLRAVLTDYFNWQGRRIPTEPRAVHQSAELVSSAKAVEHRDLLERLVRKIVDGDDLNAHRSRGAEKLTSRDRMLADWDVQHLHFEPKGGMDDLVFAVLDPGNAYLIGIYPHGSWALQEVGEIIVRNWPDAEIFKRSNYAIGLTREFTDDERATLRNANISTSSIMVDGQLWTSRAIGQTADGGSMIAAREAMAFQHQLNVLRWNFSERIEEIKTEVERALRRGLAGELKPTVHDGWYGFYQDEDDVFARIGELP